jgi:GDPmannose 4,6-dehydratase
LRKSKTALITGITGQDGAYLAEFLLKKGYTVFGTYRRVSSPNFWRLEHLGIKDKVKLISMNFSNSKSISKTIIKSNPDEIYNFLAQSSVSISFEQPIQTTNITGLGVTMLLEEIRKSKKMIKFYQAGSSEMYGNEKSDIKNEKTSFNPISPYAISKLYGFWMTNLYREVYGIHATNGILFNHESPLRGLEFVTRKISNGVARIALGLENNLELGNLAAKRDWGYAPEYVEGMWKMLQQKNPDDYVLSTDETHSILELANYACKIANISKSKIKTKKSNFRPYDIIKLKGDYSKAERKLGWKPKVKFKKLVKIMVEEDLKRWEGWLKGERFPWDLTHKNSTN